MQILDYLKHRAEESAAAQDKAEAFDIITGEGGEEDDES